MYHPEMIGDIVPDNFDFALMKRPMDIVVVEGEVVMTGGASAIVLDAASAFETGIRLILAAKAVHGAGDG